MNAEIQKSTNHAGFLRDPDTGIEYEYLVIDEQVYKCPLDADMSTDGNRTGTWECSVTMGLQHPEVYPFLQEPDSWQQRVYNAPVSHRGNPTLFRSPITETFVSIE